MADNAIPAFGALIIGDELLSGRREDKHLGKVLELLKARGLRLASVRYVGDERPRLVQTLRESFASGDIVFSFGGIGATPDDHTRQAAAEALGLPLALHPEARPRSVPASATRPLRSVCRWASTRKAARSSPTPTTASPASPSRNHFFVPGFPVMAWPMVEWVLDTRFAHLHHQQDYVEQSVIVWDAMEGKLIDLMERITADFPDATLFSLPSVGGEGGRRHIELGMKGPAQRVAAAMALITPKSASAATPGRPRPPEMLRDLRLPGLPRPALAGGVPAGRPPGRRGWRWGPACSPARPRRRALRRAAGDLRRAHGSAGRLVQPGLAAGVRRPVAAPQAGLLLWFAADEAARPALFWSILVFSAIFSHAPASFRHRQL